MGGSAIFFADGGTESRMKGGMMLLLLSGLPREDTKERMVGGERDRSTGLRFFSSLTLMQAVAISLLL